MNNFEAVFVIVKDICKVGVPNDTCFFHLETVLAGDRRLPPATTYLKVFRNLGLIKFNERWKKITLTNKGGKTDSLFATNGGLS